jgi:hypothetical protein
MQLPQSGPFCESTRKVDFFLGNSAVLMKKGQIFQKRVDSLWKLLLWRVDPTNLHN